MALKFSQGLLSSLGSYGQGGSIPSDPRQQSLMQQYGVTNPMLLALGRSLGQAIPGFETRSAQEQAMDAVRKSRGRGEQAQRETISKLRGLGYDEQADKLEARLATQAGEAVAMTQLNEAATSGLITQEERDTYLKGIGTRTIDPSAAISLIQNKREKIATKAAADTEEAETKAKQKENAFKILENGKKYLQPEQYDLIKGQIENEGLYGQQLAGMINSLAAKQIEKDKLVKRLTVYGENIGVNDVVKGMIEDGTVTSIAEVRQLQAGDGMSIVPSPILEWFAGRDDELSKGLEALIPGDGRVKNDVIWRLASHMRSTKEAEARAAKEDKPKDVINISNVEMDQLANTYRVLKENGSIDEDLLQEKVYTNDSFGLETNNLQDFVTKARQKYRDLPNEEAILRHYQDVTGSSQAQPVGRYPEGTADGIYNDPTYGRVRVVNGLVYKA